MDVVALGNGGAITATLVKNLAYPNATANDLQVAPGTYTLAVVPTGMTSPVLPTAAGATLTLKAGEIVTIAAVGCLNTSAGPCVGGSPFAFKVLSGQLIEARSHRSVRRPATAAFPDAAQRAFFWWLARQRALAP